MPVEFEGKKVGFVENYWQQGESLKGIIVLIRELIAKCPRLISWLKAGKLIGVAPHFDGEDDVYVDNTGDLEYVPNKATLYGTQKVTKLLSVDLVFEPKDPTCIIKGLTLRGELALRAITADRDQTTQDKRPFSRAERKIRSESRKVVRGLCDAPTVSSRLQANRRFHKKPRPVRAQWPSCACQSGPQLFPPGVGINWAAVPFLSL